MPGEVKKKYIVKCRNLIPAIRPKFALVIHDDNLPKFSDNPRLNMITDSNLHNYINYVLNDFHHYKNIDNLDQPSLTMAVLEKYFSNKLEEHIVILTPKPNSEDMFKSLERKVSVVSSDIVCSFYDEFTISSIGSAEINAKLKKTGQIIVFNIPFFDDMHKLCNILSLAKNVLIFYYK